MVGLRGEDYWVKLEADNLNQNERHVPLQSCLELDLRSHSFPDRTCFLRLPVNSNSLFGLTQSAREGINSAHRRDWLPSDCSQHQTSGASYPRAGPLARTTVAESSLNQTLGRKSRKRILTKWLGFYKNRFKQRLKRMENPRVAKLSASQTSTTETSASETRTLPPQLALPPSTDFQICYTSSID